jgi:sugar phosphate isomerase/epimerase
MRKRKLAVQLYTLRNEAAKSGMAYVLKAVADIGYMGVEPAGWGDLTPQDFKKACDDLGLEIVSAHGIPCAPDNVDQGIELAKELGLKHIICGYGPAEFKDLDTIKRTAEKTCIVADKVEAAGLILAQHNHAHEFEYLDGKLKYDIYAELCPKVKFQLDIYWATNYFKNSEVEMIEHFNDRIELLHLKDGIGVGQIHMRPLGEGKLDIPGAMAASPDHIDSVIVELDNTPYNQIIALQRSYDYMTAYGLGIGYR